MPSAGDGGYAVRLREDAAGWRRMGDDIRLTPEEPVLDGLTEQEADDLLRSQWALVPYEDDESETCQVVKDDGEVCGRELPCQYHSEDSEE